MVKITSQSVVQVQVTAQHSWDEALQLVAFDKGERPMQGQHLLTLLRTGQHLSQIACLDEMLHSVLADVVSALGAQRRHRPGRRRRGSVPARRVRPQAVAWPAGLQPNLGEERGLLFLVMEFLEGESLEDWLKHARQPSAAQVLRLGREIALGLAAAHARGVIHRDIKPANLWLELPRGRIKILDFGLARNLAGVFDLSPLKGLPLTELSCFSTRLTDLSPLQGMPLKDLRFSFFEPERDITILRSIPTLETINGQPAAEFWKEHARK